MQPPQINNRPVVGILTSPLTPFKDSSVKDTSYIPGSYVSHIESGGARVVPIRITDTISEIEALFHQVNGILIPGGEAKFFDSTYPDLVPSDYMIKGCHLFDLVKKANDEGNYIPLWGTCLGF